MSGSTAPRDLPERFDAWLQAAVARTAPLRFQDIRKGVQAVSTLYVEGRHRGALGARATQGPARRAALSTYYAALHFLTVREALQSLGPEPLGTPTELWDLGCGTGAAGAGVATVCNGSPRVVGIDRSGWALSEARHTYAAFGLRAHTRRASLPDALPRRGAGTVAILGWVMNELEAPAREQLLSRLDAILARGARLLLLEPLSGRVSPWWDEAAERLAARGVEPTLFRTRAERPAWLARMDRAAGLDHAELGARVLFGPRS